MKYAILFTALTLFSASTPALAQTVKEVEILNLPAVQDVTGDVEVTNLPEVQDVHVVNAPTCATTAERQLVGFTTATATGDAGILGFTRMCQAEFPGSRFCTTVEVADTADVPPVLLGPRAWVRPVRGGDLSRDAVTGGVPSDCLGWRTTASDRSGLAVDTKGVILSFDCEISQPVACCGEVQ